MKKGPFFDTVKSVRIRECLDEIKSGRFTKEKRQTLNDIGLEIGYTPETISRIKNGHQEASLEFAQLLIDHYCHDISLDYLMGKSDFKSHKYFDALGTPAHGTLLIAQAIFEIFLKRGIKVSISRYYSNDEIDTMNSMIPDNEELFVKVIKEVFSSAAKIPCEFNVMWKGAKITITDADFLKIINAAEGAIFFEFMKLFDECYEITPQQKKTVKHIEINLP